MRDASSRKEQIGWYFYDWANSAFYTTVVTLFLGPYLTALAKASADSSGLIYPLGIAVDPRSYWSYLVALSVALQVLFLPVSGAIADASHRKKQLLAAFAYIGAAATIAMFFLGERDYQAGGLLFLVANVSFGASIVVYNSFLPEIAAPEERDSVSSKGWGLGYLGGGLLLAANLLLYQNAARVGLTESQAVRVSLCSAGVWWALFTLIPLRVLRNRSPLRRPSSGRNIVSEGFGQLFRTLRDMRKYPQTLTFLLAFLIYNDAIQSVIALAAQFGSDQLGMPMSSLTLLILIVQFVAFAGALLFNGIAKVMGAKRAVILSLVIWSGVILAIYSYVTTSAQFFAMGATVGVVLGGSQALSRSLFSQMIPPGREAEYFSLYEISDKGTSWLGPLLFGLALQFTGSYRLAILSFLAFFIVGMALLSRVDVDRAAAEARKPPSESQFSPSGI